MMHNRAASKAAAVALHRASGQGGYGPRSDGMSEIGASPREHAALLESVRAMHPLILAHREQLEQERRLPQPLVEALNDAGLFRMWLPGAFGGLELDIATFLRVIEELARVDGAVAWNVMISASTSMIGAFVTPAAAQALFPTPRTIGAGSFNAKGRPEVTPVAGGYRVTGRWTFASGCDHADFLGGGCLLPDANGRPAMVMLLFPREDCEIVDTWYTGGLRGTGSQDFAVTDRFVPAEQSFALQNCPPFQPGALYRFPMTTLLTVVLAPIALGIARGAIDSLIELAGAKTPTGASGLLRERASVQADVARAEALLRAARAFLYQTVDEAWQVAARGESLSVESRLLIRLATVHASQSGAQAVDLMYNAGGASSIYARSPLERAFRDVHVATQHALAATANYEAIGRFILGLGGS
jgi:alkylation response protein AidB-like acyl-CoA dehydrogenase